MFGYSKIKTGLVIAVVVIGFLFALPNFLPKTVLEQLPKGVQAWFKPITLGLDLQGGSYLLMEVDTDELIKEKLTTLADLTRSELRAQRIRFAGLTVENGAMHIRILNAADVASAREAIRKLETSALNIEANDNALTVSYTPEALEEMERKAVTQSLEIVRKRIDELGTKEPLIQQQGMDRIVIQLPGVPDTSEIKAIMGKTAKMSLHLVDEETAPPTAQLGKL